MENCTKLPNLFILPFTQILFPWLIVIGIISSATIGAYLLIVKPRMREAYGLITSFVAIGALLGITAGASKTPVIGTFLPALITLVTAITGYIFTRDGLAKFRPVIPFCFVGMMMATVVNLFAGTSISERSRIYDRDYDAWLLERKMVIDVQKEFMLLMAKNGEFTSFPPPIKPAPCEPQTKIQALHHIY